MLFRRKNFRFGFLLCGWLVSSLWLAACGELATPTPSPVTASPASNSTPDSASANPVTLTWAFWGDDAEVAINRKLITLFEKSNPGIKIKTLHDSWQNYFKHLETDWTGANAPDVMFLEYIPTYASEGLLENLQPYIAAEKNFKVDDFYPALLDMFRYKDGLYGFPRDNDTKVIYVNTRMFKEAGLSLPQAGWTWQDLRETAKKLTKRDASGKVTQYGYAFEMDDWWRLWVWQNGGEIFENFTPPDPPAHLQINTPEAAEALQFYADLINKDKVSPGYDEMNSSDQISQLFTSGKVAMAFGNHALIPDFGNVKDLAWDVVPLPQGKKRVNALGGAGYVMHKNSQHKAQAWQLVKFLSDLGQQLFMDSGLIFPARQSIREDNIFIKTVNYNAQVFVDETKLGRQNPLFRSSNRVVHQLDLELVPVWKGQKTAAEVLPTLDAKVQPLLVELRR